MDLSFLEVSQNASRFLSEQLLEEFSRLEGWLESGPIALGSWSREELSAHSDIDLLFVGHEEVAKSVISKIQKAGYPIRARLLESKSDWTQGVEELDILSLISAKSFNPEYIKDLEIQKNKILLNKSLLESCWKAIFIDFEERKSRYSSISNYLEPNIKYQPGGLRDLLQSYQLVSWSGVNFQKDFRVLQVLQANRSFLLLIKHIIHFEQSSDILLANLQSEVASQLGFATVVSLNQEVQNIFEQNHFYTSWMMEVCKENYPLDQELEFNSLDEGLLELSKDANIFTQKRLRDYILVHHSDHSKLTDSEKMRMSKDFLEKLSLDNLSALYNTKLLDLLIPDFQRIRGLVQHDQYHRFTVAAHTIECLRNCLKLESGILKIPAFQEIIDNLIEKDWAILKYTALFHDLAKGTDRDHSEYGSELVEDYFHRYNLNQDIAEEVSFLVLEHLSLSHAAFRRNHQDMSTWEWLKSKSLTVERAKLLAVFTCIDILSTNKEAWTIWKEKLLFNVVEAYISKGTQTSLELIELAKSKYVNYDLELIHQLDSFLVEELNDKNMIIDDLWDLQNKNCEEIKIFKRSENRYWIRVYKENDEAGVLHNILSRLNSAGISFLFLSAHSFTKYGLYDWLLVKSRMLPEQILKIWPNTKIKEIIVEDEIDSIREDYIEKDKTILVFRAKQNTNLILRVSQFLSIKKVNIQWAKFNNWGRQLEMVVCAELSKESWLNIKNDI